MVPLVTDAIVLHAFDYLDTSRILRLATRDSGVVSVIARGARRSVKRFGSAMDLFAGGSAEIAHRPGRDLHHLLRFDVTNAHGALAADLDRFMAASMLSELALHGLRESDHGSVFEALEDAFARLAQSQGRAARVEGVGVAWRLLAALGFSPSLDHCAHCQAAVDADDDVFFSHLVGGVLCAACAGHGRGGRRLPVAARDQIRHWLAGIHVDVTDDAMLRAHVRLLREFIERHLHEGELRAFRAWAARFSPSGP